MDIVHAEKYYSQIKERFPELNEKQIDAICKHGLRQLYSLSKSNADVCVRSPYYTAYFGKLFRKTMVYRRYYKIKWTVKYRLKYLREKPIFNGKYYFTADKDFYDLIYGKHSKKHKLRVDEITIYKVYGEAALTDKEYIFEIDYPEDLGFKYKLIDSTIRNPKCIGKRFGYCKYEPISTKSFNEARKNKYVKRWS